MSAYAGASNIYNIYSAGVTSKNKFEGSILIDNRTIDVDVASFTGIQTKIEHGYTGALKTLGSFIGNEVLVDLGFTDCVVAGPSSLFSGVITSTAGTLMTDLCGLNLDFSGINVSTIISGDFYGISIEPPPCNVVGIAYGLYVGDFTPSGYGSGASAAYNIVSAGTGWNLFEGRVIQGAPDSPISDLELANSQCSFYLDEGTDVLKVKVKYSSGIVKTGEVTLS
jgi:hypothetical protein